MPENTHAHTPWFHLQGRWVDADPRLRYHFGARSLPPSSSGPQGPDIQVPLLPRAFSVPPCFLCTPAQRWPCWPSGCPGREGRAQASSAQHSTPTILPDPSSPRPRLSAPAPQGLILLSSPPCSHLCGSTYSSRPPSTMAPTGAKDLPLLCFKSCTGSPLPCCRWLTFMMPFLSTRLRGRESNTLHYAPPSQVGTPSLRRTRKFKSTLDRSAFHGLLFQSS